LKKREEKASRRTRKKMLIRLRMCVCIRSLSQKQETRG